jgi:hypothetical protein
MALQYHPGQIEVQEEANTRRVADMLANWVGPVGLFASVADLIVVATADEAGDLRFATVSGEAPLVDVVADGTIRIEGLMPAIAGESAPAGGLAISLAQLRRARINGRLTVYGSGSILEADEAFTNCRKYVVPSLAVDGELRAGPREAAALSLDDPWLADVIARAETSFLASVSPEGQPDVSHRGGARGFLRYEAAAGTLSWGEYVGDGMLKSAGNIRATGRASLLVLDLESGDAAEVTGTAAYTTLRTAKRPREDALQEHKEAFPLQGEMSFQVAAARRLISLVAARRRLEKALRVTSASSIDDQAPQ